MAVSLLKEEEESARTGCSPNTTRRRARVDFIPALTNIQGHGQETKINHHIKKEFKTNPKFIRKSYNGNFD